MKNWPQGNYPQITPMDTDENLRAKKSVQSASSVDKAFDLFFEKHKTEMLAGYEAIPLSRQRGLHDLAGTQEKVINLF